MAAGLRGTPRGEQLLPRAPSLAVLLLATAGVVCATTEQYCSDLKCPSDTTFKGSVTNGSYYYDFDFDVWRPEQRPWGGTDGAEDSSLSSSVEWRFSGPGTCSDAATGLKGVKMTYAATVWGQPHGGPPWPNDETAVEMGVELEPTSYCCVVVGPTGTASREPQNRYRGKCAGKECELTLGASQPKECIHNSDCSVCNLVMTLENPKDPKVAHFDRSCEYLMASSEVRLDYFAWQRHPANKDDHNLTDWIVAAPVTVRGLRSLPDTSTAFGSNGVVAVNNMLLTVPNTEAWPYTTCTKGRQGIGPFASTSVYTSSACRGCAPNDPSGACGYPLRINCLNAVLKSTPRLDATDQAVFQIVWITMATLFLSSWFFLFCSVPLLSNAGGDDPAGGPAEGEVGANGDVGGDEPLAYSPIQQKRFCSGCGKSVGNKNAKFCGYCRKPRTDFVAYDSRSGNWGPAAARK